MFGQTFDLLQGLQHRVFPPFPSNAYTGHFRPPICPGPSSTKFRSMNQLFVEPGVNEKQRMWIAAVERIGKAPARRSLGKPLEKLGHPRTNYIQNVFDSFVDILSSCVAFPVHLPVFLRSRPPSPQNKRIYVFKRICVSVENCMFLFTMDLFLA